MPAGQGSRSLWLNTAAHRISGHAMHGIIPVPRAGDCFIQCRAAHFYWPSQPSGAAHPQLPEPQHARQRHPSASARAAARMAVLKMAGLVQKCVGCRHSRCMGLHILVGLVGLAAQPLSLSQRGCVRLLAALAAVLVVVQLLVRCRLLLPASVNVQVTTTGPSSPQVQTLQQGFRAVPERQPACCPLCYFCSHLASSDPGHLPPVMACTCTAATEVKRQEAAAGDPTHKSPGADSALVCQASVPERQLCAGLRHSAELDINQSHLQSSGDAHLMGLSLDSSS